MFIQEFSVRDYECDLQGIVNNSVYMNYLEHTRHEFLKASGIDFVQYHEQGKDLVVIRAEMDYKQSLRPGDEFYVTISFQPESKLKFAFNQEIRKKGDDALVLTAKITGVCLVKGRPRPEAELFEQLKMFSEAQELVSV